MGYVTEEDAQMIGMTLANMISRFSQNVNRRTVYTVSAFVIFLVTFAFLVWLSGDQSVDACDPEDFICMMNGNKIVKYNPDTFTLMCTIVLLLAWTVLCLFFFYVPPK